MVIQPNSPIQSNMLNYTNSAAYNSVKAMIVNVRMQNKKKKTHDSL